MFYVRIIINKIGNQPVKKKKTDFEKVGLLSVIILDNEID